MVKCNIAVLQDHSQTQCTAITKIMDETRRKLKNVIDMVSIVIVNIPLEFIWLKIFIYEGSFAL